MTLSAELSARAFAANDDETLKDWLLDVEMELQGVRWVPLGGIDNNVHTVEVASDPAFALVERPTNSIDALLDLRAMEHGETAQTPHDAATKWWAVPQEGLAGMSEAERREIAGLVQITMLESGEPTKPTILIQDQGTGQHPEDFGDTLLSLLASNKKTKNHVMGVYNAGGAASYKFAKATIVASRLAPQLLGSRPDETGISVVRYNPLDPEKFKSGVYEYLVDKSGRIIRLGVDVLPDLPYGAYVKLIEYEMPRYARAAYEPQRSLWHLLHGALPDPALPMQIIERRSDRFSGVRGDAERRVVNGMQYLLGRADTSCYHDRREIDLGPEVGSVVLRYYVLGEGRDPNAYTTAEQGLTVTLNGQRQIAKPRQWVKRQTDLTFLFNRLVVVVDGTRLTSAAKRDVFVSTRETGVDSPLSTSILDRVIQELQDDDRLWELEDLAKQRVFDAATKTTSDRIKKRLANQIGAYLKGDLKGREGGRKKRKSRPSRPRPKPSPVDDSALLDVPDKLTLVTDPPEISPGETSTLMVDVNAKNDFLPTHRDGLSVVFGKEWSEHLAVRSTGRLLGGRVRITLEADLETPLGATSIKVALVVPSLGVFLTDEGAVEIKAPKEEKEADSPQGGEPDIDVSWVRRDVWDEFAPPWTEESVGICQPHRDDPADPAAITRVEWVLNENFAPYESVIDQKRFSETSLKNFREGYEYPVLFGLFHQRLAEEEKEQQADETGKPIEVPDDYVEGEKARLARAVLMAKEPEIQIVLAQEGE